MSVVGRHEVFNSLLQQPGHKKFKLSKIELTYKAKKIKVPVLLLTKLRLRSSKSGLQACLESFGSRSETLRIVPEP